MDPALRIEGYDRAVFERLGFDTDPEGTFGGLVGIVWDLLSPDRAEAHLDVEDRHKQPFGLVHGGVHATIVETVGSVAGAARVLADGKAAVGVHNSTDFVRPVRGGRLDAVATPIHVGRTQHLWLVEVVDSTGRLAARGQLRLQVVDPPTG